MSMGFLTLSAERLARRDGTLAWFGNDPPGGPAPDHRAAGSSWKPKALHRSDPRAVKGCRS